MGTSIGFEQEELATQSGVSVGLCTTSARLRPIYLALWLHISTDTQSEAQHRTGDLFRDPLMLSLRVERCFVSKCQAIRDVEAWVGVCRPRAGDLKL